MRDELPLGRARGQAQRDAGLRHGEEEEEEEIESSKFLFFLFSLEEKGEAKSRSRFVRKNGPGAEGEKKHSVVDLFLLSSPRRRRGAGNGGRARERAHELSRRL